jgi:uncharacterized membrane protein
LWDSLARADRDVIALRNNVASLSDRVKGIESWVVEQLSDLPAPPKKPEELPSEVPVSEPRDRHRLVDAAAPSPSVPFGIPAEEGPTPFQRIPGAAHLTELRFGQKWLLIVGVVVVVLAVGYFLKYAFDNNWISEAGRVGLAYLAGIGLLGVGEWFRRRSLAVFGLYLIGGGIAVLYSSTYAASQVYLLIGQTPAFGVMVLVTAAAAGLALAYDTRWLAVLGIIGGFLTPVVLSTGADKQIALMTYMAILNAGIFSIAMFKRWHILARLGCFFTWGLFAAWFAQHYAEPKFWLTTIYLNVFFLIYAFVPFAYYFVRHSGQRVTGYIVTIPNALIAFGFSFYMIEQHYSTEAVGVATLTYAFIFLAMAGYLRLRRPVSDQAFVFLLAKGLVFLYVTVPIVVSGYWITVFWAVGAAVSLWVALRIESSYLRGGAIVVLTVTAGKLVLYDYANNFGFRVLNYHFRNGFAATLAERWITSGVVLGATLASAWLTKAAGLCGGSWKRDYAAFMYAVFTVLLFVVLNIEVAGGFYDAAPEARFASISVLWALFALLLMVFGFARNLALLRHCSIVLFAITCVKVFGWDMSNVSTPYRILSLIVLGLMLIGASYLYHRFKESIHPAAEGGDA